MSLNCINKTLLQTVEIKCCFKIHLAFTMRIIVLQMTEGSRHNVLCAEDKPLSKWQRWDGSGLKSFFTMSQGTACSPKGAPRSFSCSVWKLPSGWRVTDTKVWSSWGQSCRHMLTPPWPDDTSMHTFISSIITLYVWEYINAYKMALFKSLHCINESCVRCVFK